MDAEDGDRISTDRAATFTVRRNATLIVTGKPARADWKTHNNAGYAGRSVKLRFRRSGTATYRTVKTVTSGSGGALRATAGAAGDHVGVR